MRNFYCLIFFVLAGLTACSDNNDETSNPRMSITSIDVVGAAGGEGEIIVNIPGPLYVKADPDNEWCRITSIDGNTIGFRVDEINRSPSKRAAIITIESEEGTLLAKAEQKGMTFVMEFDGGNHLGNNALTWKHNETSQEIPYSLDVPVEITCELSEGDPDWFNYEVRDDVVFLGVKSENLLAEDKQITGSFKAGSAEIPFTLTQKMDGAKLNLDHILGTYDIDFRTASPAGGMSPFSSESGIIIAENPDAKPNGIIIYGLATSFEGAVVDISDTEERKATREDSRIYASVDLESRRIYIKSHQRLGDISIRTGALKYNIMFTNPFFDPSYDVSLTITGPGSIYSKGSVNEITAVVSGSMWGYIMTGPSQRWFDVYRETVWTRTSTSTDFPTPGAGDDD